MFADYTQDWGCTEFLETLLNFFFRKWPNLLTVANVTPGGGTCYEAC